MAENAKDVGLTGSAIEEVRELADEASGVVIGEPMTSPDGVKFTFGSKSAGGGKVEPFSLKPFVDEWRERPKFRKGNAQADTLASFIDLVNRHKDTDSVVFAGFTSSAPWLQAVIDYHTIVHLPRWLGHRIFYKFPISDEFKAWNAADGKAMQQAEFAEFIEERIPDFTSADQDEANLYEAIMQTKFGAPSKLMELSRGMQVSVNSVVKEALTLQSGEMQVQYEETHTDIAGKPLKIPGLFMISIPLFTAAEPTRLPVRLRYRKGPGGLTWAFSIYRKQQAFLAALQREAATVREAVSLPVYEGASDTHARYADPKKC